MVSIFKPLFGSMIPRFSLARWGGGDEVDYQGWSLDIQWLGFIIEINIGRARR